MTLDLLTLAVAGAAIVICGSLAFWVWRWRGDAAREADRAEQALAQAETWVRIGQKLRAGAALSPGEQALLYGTPREGDGG